MDLEKENALVPAVLGSELCQQQQDNMLAPNYHLPIPHPSTSTRGHESASTYTGEMSSEAQEAVQPDFFSGEVPLDEAAKAVISALQGANMKARTATDTTSCMPLNFEASFEGGERDRRPPLTHSYTDRGGFGRTSARGRGRLSSSSHADPRWSSSKPGSYGMMLQQAGLQQAPHPRQRLQSQTFHLGPQAGSGYGGASSTYYPLLPNSPFVSLNNWEQLLMNPTLPSLFQPHNVPSPPFLQQQALLLQQQSLPSPLQSLQPSVPPPIIPSSSMPKPSEIFSLLQAYENHSTAFVSIARQDPSALPLLNQMQRENSILMDLLTVLLKSSLENETSTIAQLNHMRVLVTRHVMQYKSGVSTAFRFALRALGTCLLLLCPVQRIDLHEAAFRVLDALTMSDPELSLLIVQMWSLAGTLSTEREDPTLPSQVLLCLSSSASKVQKNLFPHLLESFPSTSQAGLYGPPSGQGQQRSLSEIPHSLPMGASSLSSNDAYRSVSYERPLSSSWSGIPKSNISEQDPRVESTSLFQNLQNQLAQGRVITPGEGNSQLFLGSTDLAHWLQEYPATEIDRLASPQMSTAADFAFHPSRSISRQSSLRPNYASDVTMSKSALSPSSAIFLPHGGGAAQHTASTAHSISSVFNIPQLVDLSKSVCFSVMRQRAPSIRPGCSV